MGGLSRNGCSHPYTGTFYHLRDRCQISLHFKVNLLASKANLKRTENCKSNEFIKKVLKISEPEVDLKWTGNEFEETLESIWNEFFH